jgi:hypothetical protein
MKIHFILPLLALIAVLGSSCEADHNDSLQKNYEIQKTTWLLYEQGYSPGAGYYTDPVPESLQQTILFEADNKFSTTIEGLDKYKYYRIVEDSISSRTVLVLHTNDPGNRHVDIDQEHSYNMEFVDGNLKLYYRYCIEGCHMAFKQVKKPTTR